MNQTNKLIKLFGSSSRVSLLKYFISNEKQLFRMGELAKKTKVNKHLVSTELKKLTEIGILLQEQTNNIVVFKLNSKSMFYTPLKEIFREDDWYEWERSSRIHHLLLTLEAGLTPMKEYYGYCIPDLHCVFDYDNVTIFFKMSEFR
ncbi:MAG: hypothetical protein Q7R95_02160, partial [bacterium]|nr:hypothetical protein [bacterium]